MSSGHLRVHPQHRIICGFNHLSKRVPNRKWRETNQQPGHQPSCCCLVSVRNWDAKPCWGSIQLNFNRLFNGIFNRLFSLTECPVICWKSCWTSSWNSIELSPWPSSFLALLLQHFFLPSSTDLTQQSFSSSTFSWGWHAQMKSELYEGRGVP